MSSLLRLQHRGQDDAGRGEPGPGGDHHGEGEDLQQRPYGRGDRDVGLRDRGQHPGGRGYGNDDDDNDNIDDDNEVGERSSLKMSVVGRGQTLEAGAQVASQLLLDKDRMMEV